MPTVYAALEGGGTTFVVAIAHDDPTNIVERAEFKTTSPAETIGKCCGAWPPARPLPHTRPPPPCDGRAPARASSRPRVRRRTADPRRASSLPSAAWLKTRRYDALGVATFGPVDLDPASPTYGYITTTPKPGWKHTDVLGPLRAVDPSAPILFDTDVNAPQRGQTRRPGSGRAAPSTARSALPFAHSGPLGPRAQGYGRVAPAVQPWCLTEAPPKARVSTAFGHPGARTRRVPRDVISRARKVVTAPPHVAGVHGGPCAPSAPVLAGTCSPAAQPSVACSGVRRPPCVWAVATLPTQIHGPPHAGSGSGWAAARAPT